MTKKTQLDLSYLKTMSGGDPQTMKSLLEALANELKNDLPRARKLYEAENWEGLERFCHHFKSTLSFSGDSALINANLALWDIARSTPSADQKGIGVIKELERRGKMVAQEVNRILKQ